MKLLLGMIFAIMLSISQAESVCAPNTPCQQTGNIQSVPIIAFHRITTSFPPGETVISPDQFNEHLIMLTREGYTTIRVEELVSFMRGQILLPQKTVVLTFDDGWKDQLLAAKMMSEHGFSATFYITSGHFENPEYMTTDDVITLSKNRSFEIGAHSHSHFTELEDKDKTKMELRAMVGEMMMSKSILENLINRDVKDYAWPYGFATTESVQYAERFGFASTAMINDISKNVAGRTMELQRLNIDGRCTSDALKMMLETGKYGDCK